MESVVDKLNVDCLQELSWKKRVRIKGRASATARFRARLHD
jgi:hypothetical protein